MSLDGFHEWTTTEYDEKEAAENAAPMPLLSLIAGKTKDEYNLDFTDHSKVTLNYSQHQTAVNMLLAWLEFPSDLLPLMNTIVGFSKGSNKKFSATDMQLGLHLKIGRKRKAESSKKSLSRAKKLFRQWQIENQIQLIQISGKLFNPQKQRNEPTEYQVFINDWAAETLVIAQNKYAKDWIRIKKRDLAIQKAARDFLHSLPECPPLESIKETTMPTDRDFDRKIKIARNALIGAGRLLNQANKSHQPLFRQLGLEMKVLEDKEFGTVEETLTPQIDEIDFHSATWARIESGEINYDIEKLETRLREKARHLENVDFDRLEYASQVVKSENREIEVPRKWEDGKFSSYSNEIPVQNDDLPKGQIPSETCTNQPENDANLLNSLSVEGTNLTEQTKTPSLENIIKIVQHWSRQTENKLKDGTPDELEAGKWQIHHFDYEAVTPAQIETEAIIEEMISEVTTGAKTLIDLKAAFVNYAISRCEYWKGKRKTSVLPSAERRAQLESWLTLPEEFEDA